MIHFCSPYRTDKDLGRAYNDFLRMVGDNDWVCLTDYDTMLLTPDACSMMEKYIDTYPSIGLFTCYTNRVAACQTDQLYKGRVSEDPNILNHAEIASALSNNPLSVTDVRHNVSGVLMLISKATWQEVGGFKEGVGCLGVDVDFSSRVKALGKRVVRMDTIYIFHYYRMKTGVKNKTHLIPTNKTVYTAVFGDYEKLKEPTIVTPGWKYVVFTDKPITSKTWDVKVVTRQFDCPRREARWYKANAHKIVDTTYSMWVDASFIIRCDLNQYWSRWYKMPFSAPRHPARKCVYDEIQSVINAKRGGSELIIEQGEHYRSIGVAKYSGVITSGVIMREHTQRCNELCEAWWEETSKWSLRDQVSFCAVQPNFQDVIHTFGWAYNTASDLKYIKHHDPMNKKI